MRLQRVLVFVSLSLPCFAGIIGGGTSNCTGSPQSAFSVTWQVCGNVTGGSNLTLDSTTGTVNFTPLNTFTGGVIAPVFGGITGTDGSAALFAFTATGSGNLQYHVNASGNVVFYVEAIFDGVVIGSDSNSKLSPFSTSFGFTQGYGAGPHSFVLDVVNGVSSLGDPMMTLDIFTLTPGTILVSSPEPGTGLLLGTAILAFGLLRLRR
jgi:hypothetical protein